MIPNRAPNIQPGMLSVSLSLFMPTNQNVSSYKTRREFAFSRRRRLALHVPYSWIERPCHYRYKSIVSGTRIARTDLRPATSVSERGASGSISTKKKNSKTQKLAFMIFMIRPFPILGRSGFVSSMMSLFTPTNQIVSSLKTRRGNAFFRQELALRKH